MFKAQQGFTLIELVVVIAIIGVAAATALPRIDRFISAQELTNAAAGLAADLRYLRELNANGGAGAGATHYQIKFNNGTRASYAIYANLTPVKQVALPGSVQFYGTLTPFYFDMSGVPAAGRSFALKSLKGAGSKWVIVAGVTGRVRISGQSDLPEDDK